MKAKELLEILKSYSEDFLEKADIKIRNNEIKPADIFGILVGGDKKGGEVSIYTTELFPAEKPKVLEDFKVRSVEFVPTKKLPPIGEIVMFQYEYRKDDKTQGEDMMAGYRKDNGDWYSISKGFDCKGEQVVRWYDTESDLWVYVKRRVL